MADKKQIQELRTTLSMDSDQFKRTAKETQADLKALKSEMNFVKAEGKEYAKSLDGLTKQQDILNRQLKVQQEQLEQVKKKYDAAVKSTGENSTEARKLQAQYNNLAAQIRKTENQLESVNKAIEEQSNKWIQLSKRLTDASDKAKAAGEKLSDFGQNMTTKVSAPLAAVGLAAFNMASQFEQATGIIQAEMGNSSISAEKLEKVVKSLWEQGFGENPQEVAASVSNVAKALGDLSEVDLSYVTKGLSLFEQRGWADQREALRAMKVLMEQFGLSAQESMDRLTWGFQSNLDYSGEFLDSISEYSTYYAEMGLSVDDMFARFKAGAETGAFQLDKIGDAMKEFTLRAKDGSKTSAEAFQALGLNADEMTRQFNAGGETAKKAFETVVKAIQNTKDETTKNAAAVGLFGTQYEDLGEKAFDAMLQATEGLGNVEGATKKASDALQNNFATRVKKVWREFQSDLAPAGDALLDIAENILPKAADAIGDVTDAFADLSPETQETIVKIAGITAAAGPAFMAIGSLSSGISGLLKVGGSLAELLGKSNEAGLLGRIAGLGMKGPVGLAVAGVGLLAGGIYALSKASKDNTEETLKSIESREKDIESLDKTISRFDELQNKNKLSTDEMLRYMDIMSELKDAKSEEAIQKLTEEQNNLLEKSGLTNDEMLEFLDLNGKIVEKSPETEKAISNQGNAYATTTDKVKELNEAERKRLEQDTYNKIVDGLDNQARNLEKQKELQRTIKDLEADRKNHLNESITIGEKIKEQDLIIAGLREKMATATDEERLKYADKLLLAQKEKADLEGILQIHDGQIEKIDKTIEKKQNSLDKTNEELSAFDNLLEKYAGIILQEQGINFEKGKAVEAIQTQQTEIDTARAKLQEMFKNQQISRAEYEAQNAKLDEQQGKIDAAKAKLEAMNEVAGRTVYKDVNVSTNPSADKINRDLSQPVQKQINIGFDEAKLTERIQRAIPQTVRINYIPTSPRRYAIGTDFHPGGQALVGEEGPELAKLSRNRWAMLDFGIYDLPRGAQVFTHDETKKILGALNRIPAYASGVSPSGEANRIVGQLSEESYQTSIVIQNMNIRNDTDIKKVARELYNLQKAQKRGVGYR